MAFRYAGQPLEQTRKADDRGHRLSRPRLRVRLNLRRRLLATISVRVRVEQVRLVHGTYQARPWQFVNPERPIALRIVTRDTLPVRSGKVSRVALKIICAIDGLDR